MLHHEPLRYVHHGKWDDAIWHVKLECPMKLVTNYVNFQMNEFRQYPSTVAYLKFYTTTLLI